MQSVRDRISAHALLRDLVDDLGLARHKLLVHAGEGLEALKLRLPSLRLRRQEAEPHLYMCMYTQQEHMHMSACT